MHHCKIAFWSLTQSNRKVKMMKLHVQLIWSLKLEKNFVELMGYPLTLNRLPKMYRRLVLDHDLNYGELYSCGLWHFLCHKPQLYSYFSGVHAVLWDSDYTAMTVCSDETVTIMETTY